MAGIDDFLKPYEPDYDFIIDTINSIYYPANSASESDELLTTFDILETLRGMDPQLTSKHVHETLINIGFRVKYIDGAAYWPVKVK